MAKPSIPKVSEELSEFLNGDSTHNLKVGASVS